MRNFSIVALMFFSLIGVAQSDNDQKQNRLSVYAGLGAFPFGLSSVPVSSRKYLSDGNPYISNVVGVDFLTLDQKIGFFIESSSGQNFISKEWIPFWPSQENEEYYNTRIISFETKATGFNSGLLIGNMITPNFQIHAKVGAGFTYHNYKFSYQSIVGGSQFVQGKERVFNYQLAVQTKFYPVEHVGFVSSIAISKGNSVFTLGVVGSISL